MESQHIVIIGPAYPLRGGIADFNEALAQELLSQNYKVTIVSFSLQYPSFLFPGKTQFDFSNPPKGFEILSIINSINPLSWFYAAYCIIKLKPKVVITRFWIPFIGISTGTINGLIRLMSGLNVVAITDNINPHEKRPFDGLFTRYFLASANRFVTLSSNVLQDLIKLSPHKKAKCLHHPVYSLFGEKIEKTTSCIKLGLNPEKKYLLFFGFIRPYKGLDLLLKAFEVVCRNDSCNHLELIVAGEYYDGKEETERLIKSLAGIQNRIHMFTEFIPADRVNVYFGSADLVVQPYRNATQSGITQIAFHFGKPMIVTRVGGLSEIISEGKTGFMCDPNPESIAEAIVKWEKASSNTPFELFVEKEAKKYSWDTFVRELLCE